jgi:hypothetical protein
MISKYSTLSVICSTLLGWKGGAGSGGRSVFHNSEKCCKGEGVRSSI